MIEKALSAGEDYKAADYIEQAAKEMGGVYTGRAASAIIPEAGPPVDENKPRRLPTLRADLYRVLFARRRWDSANSRTP